MRFRLYYRTWPGLRAFTGINLGCRIWNRMGWAMMFGKVSIPTDDGDDEDVVAEEWYVVF